MHIFHRIQLFLKVFMRASPFAPHVAQFAIHLLFDYLKQNSNLFPIVFKYYVSPSILETKKSPLLINSLNSTENLISCAFQTRSVCNGTQTGMLQYHRTQIFLEFLRQFLKGGVFLFLDMWYHPCNNCITNNWILVYCKTTNYYHSTTKHKFS